MGCQEGGGNTLLSAVEADPPDIRVIYEVRPGWHLRSGDPASLAVLADPRDIDNTVGRIPFSPRLINHSRRSMYETKLCIGKKRWLVTQGQFFFS